MATPTETVTLPADETKELLQTVGDGIVAAFEQMVKGSWQDDHGHYVTMNAAMINLKSVVRAVMEFRAAHLDYSAPEALTCSPPSNPQSTKPAA